MEKKHDYERPLAELLDIRLEASIASPGVPDYEPIEDFEWE